MKSHNVETVLIDRLPPRRHLLVRPENIFSELYNMVFCKFNSKKNFSSLKIIKWIFQRLTKERKKLRVNYYPLKIKCSLPPRRPLLGRPEKICTNLTCLKISLKIIKKIILRLAKEEGTSRYSYIF